MEEINTEKMVTETNNGMKIDPEVMVVNKKNLQEILVHLIQNLNQMHWRVALLEQTVGELYKFMKEVKAQASCNLVDPLCESKTPSVEVVES